MRSESVWLSLARGSGWPGGSSTRGGSDTCCTSGSAGPFAPGHSKETHFLPGGYGTEQARGASPVTAEEAEANIAEMRDYYASLYRANNLALPAGMQPDAAQPGEGHVMV